ncbi:DUF368 domain-containing protein [Bacillus shivajii]|uniref:DUF368 domain-containing protein n=1 Tax=Bacillus shivajii TaxID=1983719 RepID=UPI001CFBC382|nr:DUF368 domain-containing protein [Bacillus shivajii]UCZ54357.1 DUF368 domain-containing protein [Bacillus shivajii]
MEWKNLYRGAMMGISELIPGVSSGTIAVILGIYDNLIRAITGFFSKEWKRHLPFLIPLGIGMVAAVAAFVKIIRWLLENHTEPTHFFFLGLIVGVLPLLWKKAKVKQTFNKAHYIALIAAMLLVASMEFFRPAEASEPIVQLTLLSGVGLFFSGWLASMSMIMPGISGSLVFLILGVYNTAIFALESLNLQVILAIGAGVLVGIIVSSKAIKYLLSHFPYASYAVIIGLVIGSIVPVFPGITSAYQLFPSIITFIAGTATALLLGSKG